jgi:hypothetical protein
MKISLLAESCGGPGGLPGRPSRPNVFTEDRLRLIVDAARARKNNEKHGILTAVQKVIDFINEVNHNPCDYRSRNRRRIDDVQ